MEEKILLQAFTTDSGIPFKLDLLDDEVKKQIPTKYKYMCLCLDKKTGDLCEDFYVYFKPVSKFTRKNIKTIETDKFIFGI